MTKTLKLILNRDAKPVRRRRGISRRDAQAQIDFLSRTGVELGAADEIRRATADTEELILAA